MGRTELKSPHIINSPDSVSLLCKDKINLSLLKESYPDLFYPQDWYEKEPFMDTFLIPGLYKLPKNIQKSSRGKSPNNQKLYPASLIAYTFIIFYKTYNEILWPNDYIWCDNFDSNGDQIYVGRYYDPLGISKNGFSIHRHLTIKENYGWL